MLSEEDASALSQRDTDPNCPAKKATRHWAAWTHEEEEKFFIALRQVGKNFEKITSQVQSKNKDQVRHYYYRLIKRMNKLLSPGFALDARNSKDVNVAMLCWWSLLEKHSCSSSKLQLKPRRLKAFVTSLEQQLLKGRKKVQRRPLIQPSKPSPDAVPESSSRATPSADSKRKSNRSNKSQSSRQSIAITINDTDNVEAATEPVLIETKSLETPPFLTEIDCDIGVNSVENMVVSSGQLDQVTETEPSTSGKLRVCTNQATESPKLKLQLFPIDEATRTTLEQDGHNPHLELTLKGKKSINSVLLHLWQKWGRSVVAQGELRLFPFTEEASPLQSWSSNDSGLSASDIYTAVGKPSLFRLRYGWTNSMKSESGEVDEKNKGEVAAERDDDEGDEVSPSDMVELRETSWLYEKSSDGFGQRLWRDESQTTHSNMGFISSELDWAQNVSQLLDTPAVRASSSEQPPPLQPQQQLRLAPTIWGEETCDAFLFKNREEFSRSSEKDVEMEGSGSGDLQRGHRSAALGLYWADSLDGGFPNAEVNECCLFNGNSSLGISATLFPETCSFDVVLKDQT